MWPCPPDFTGRGGVDGQRATDRFRFSTTLGSANSERMNSFMMLPFAVAFVCGARGFWLIGEARRRLEEKHLLRLNFVSRAYIWPTNAVWSIVMRHDYSDLGDRYLDRKVKAAKHWYRIATAAFVVYAIAILSSSLPFFAAVYRLY